MLCDAEDTVIVLPPGWRYRTDKFGFGWMERLDGSAGERTRPAMGKLFDKHVRLFDGFVYSRDAYDKRPGCDPEIIAQGLSADHRRRAVRDGQAVAPSTWSC